MAESGSLQEMQAVQGETMDRRIEKPRRWRRRLPWALAAVVGLSILAVVATTVPRAGALLVHADQVQVSTVARTSFRDYLPVRAEVAPARTVFIGAVSGGQVERVVAADGAEVAAGDVLATLSNPQLRLDVSTREAEISGRMSEASGQQLSLQTSRVDREREIAEAEYNLLRSNRELAGRQKLHDLGMLSDGGLKPYLEEAGYYRDRVQALKTGRDQQDQIAGRQIAVIRQTQARLSANLREVESSLDALTLRAPTQGRLTNFSLQPGQTLKVGDPVGQIDSEADDKLVADVDEFYLGRVAVGLPAEAQVDAAAFKLRVSRVLPQVTSGRFRVELVFTGAQPKGLKRGQSLDIRITFGDPQTALVLDNGAWLEASGGAYAFVVEPGGGRAARRAITIGRRNPEQVEVTAGLAAGERVVTSSYAGYEKYQQLILDRKVRP